jgi:hypothetical protein
VPDEEGDAAVTDRHPGDERLRDAFQSLSETASAAISPADLDEIWRAVSGELPPEERRALVDRMAVDASLAEAWRVAQEVWTASPEGAATGPAPAARVWMRPALAAAAVVFAAAAVGVWLQLSRPIGDSTFRDPGGYAIESLVPNEAALPRDAFRLRWTPGPDDSRYHVRVTTEDLRVLATVPDVAEPELVVTPDLLAGVAPGARVLWQVDATLPGGRTVSSQTFVARVR